MEIKSMTANQTPATAHRRPLIRGILAMGILGVTGCCGDHGPAMEIAIDIQIQCGGGELRRPLLAALQPRSVGPAPVLGSQPFPRAFRQPGRPPIGARVSQLPPFAAQPFPPPGGNQVFQPPPAAPQPGPPPIGDPAPEPPPPSGIPAPPPPSLPLIRPGAPSTATPAPPPPSLPPIRPGDPSTAIPAPPPPSLPPIQPGAPSRVVPPPSLPVVGQTVEPTVAPVTTAALGGAGFAFAIDP